MKSLKILSALLLFVTIFSNCAPEDDYYFTTKEIISQGIWNVEEFYAEGDKTALFEKYNLQFNPAGILKCSADNYEYTGSWNIIRDENRNDVLLISIDGPSALSDLSDAWNIQEKTTMNLSCASRDAEGRFRIRKL